ncbi:hypothetical protein VPH35_114382 [Triticum aestivum]|uniref:Uncharacterized protein n=1 Tax=Triticum aestivum TaxID=4565 RepID=A0A3B6Q8Q8_WHEAT|nr:disease resistance protein RGA5-like [Triticum aestivum]XP_044417599.1 disease resistance protein RGA5-like [Triticum aestivum]XP_044417601.1 disease resistance protein RGA5-like [Triticum aestivum]XP_044417602.1 disease resistance protein RGA5-like [Triticum aestivum]
MEFATGALGTLLPKLGELLLDEYNLQKGLKKGIKDLMDELLVIQAVLLKVSNVPLDQLDPQVKIWANDVRELSFAIEDSLDSFMVRVEGVEPTKPHTFFGFIKKTCKKVTKLKIRREIANDIKDVKIQVKEVKERFDRYKDVIGNTNARTEVDPRLLAMYTKVSDLIGIEMSTDELTERLSKGHDPSGETLKVVSVVGFGGLGKTTLAKAVYDKLNKNFDCGVFVPVGQNPDTKKVLRDILLELDRQLYRDASTMDERQLINQLQTFLVGKRYFIVIDDIWDTPTWEMINCAFMDSHPESRIIITTRDFDVATKAGGIYRMEPLSDDNSKMLFYTRTFGGEGASSDNQPAEVTNKILKKCGGVPLAIITIASLLVGKRCEDWSKVYDAIGFGHEDNKVVHNTRKILSFSYYDLPSHLKSCLLYLSMFPEDSLIGKRTLIWRWVCEGFVVDREGIGSFELGEIYFNELVNKSMIRWIDEENYGQGGCRVHDMVLDLIRTISNDINFVTVHDMEQHGTSLRGQQTNRVHRLALHGRSVEHNSSIAMEHLRSFNVVGCSANSMPLLLSFKVLRVLVIEDCVFSVGSSLEHLGKLVQLRYLGLVKTAVKIPEGIGHDLKFLEILDVRGGLISELPPSVGELMNLRCLWADKGTVMKGEIGKLTCLEELELYSVEKCPNFCTEVGKLTTLRVLKIYFAEIEESAGKALMESLCNLHNIHSLTVLDDADDGKYSIVLNHSLEDLACTKLHELALLSIVIPRVPSWINHLSVPLLSHLGLHVAAVEVGDVQTIGRLPSLLVLLLWSKDEKNISYTFGSNEFHKLRVLWTKKIEIAVGEGALPMLEVLEYRASAERKDAASLVPWRRNSCPLLKFVGCFLDCTNSSYREVKEAKQALRQASGTRPNAVYLDLYIEEENYDVEAGKFIDNLEWTLRGLDRPEDVGRAAAHQEERTRRMIRSLERRLRDAAEPRVGRYGQQEIRGLVAKFKRWLHDHAGTDQDEAGKSDDDEDYYYGDDDDGTDQDDQDDDDDYGTDQAEVDDCEAESTCSDDCN